MSSDALIAVTQEKPMAGEAVQWMQLLDAGVHRIHVRKPERSTDELVALVREVQPQYRKQLVIHRDIEAAIVTGAGGLHLPWKELTSGRLMLPSGLTLSASVHSWEEAKLAVKLSAYCLVSPVFNSISKQGYMANDELKKVPEDMKGKRFYALGGVTPDNCREAMGGGYHGVATLGYVWEQPDSAVKKAVKLLECISAKKEKT